MSSGSQFQKIWATSCDVRAVFDNVGGIWEATLRQNDQTLPKTNVKPISLLSDSAGREIGLTLAAPGAMNYFIHHWAM